MRKILHFTLDSRSQICNSQKGQSSVYIIIFVIVIIFAVMLSGGGGSLFTGNEPSSVTDTPIPTGSVSITTTPATNAWNIAVSLSQCNKAKVGYKIGTIILDGTSSGNLELFINNESISKVIFNPPQQIYKFTLGNDFGFNVYNWKLLLSTGDNIKASYDGKATGC
jgi:hypothetical protein